MRTKVRRWEFNMNFYKKSSSILLLCFILSGVLLIGGCNVMKVVNNEERMDYQLDDRVLVPDTSGTTKVKDERSLIKDMELVLANEYLELYLGKHYDIAVYNKETGKVYWSNPIFHEASEEVRNALIEESKKLLYSQVSIEYYNSNQKKLVMTSYPDSYSNDKEQVTYEITDNALKVTYGIGTNFADSGLIQAFTKETFDYYDQLLQEKVKEKSLSIIEYRTFANNYTLTSYSKLSSSEKKDYTARYPNLEQLDTIYTIKPNLTNKITNQLLEMYTTLGIDEEVKTAEEEKMGVVEGTDLPAYFSIPVVYQLHGNDLVVSVDTALIQSTGGYYLTKVELLKSFGASANEADGYLFLPDGSGSIVENGTKNRSQDKVSIPFYGQDYGLQFSNYQEIGIDSSFPVFGIKSDESSIFAIVENGAAIGGVSAQITSNYMNYNIIYPYFNYYMVDKFNREGAAYAFYDVSADVDYTIRYHFLTGEDGTYSGMANYYRTYLEQKGYLTRKSKKEQNIPLDIQLLGSITKTINKFGIPVESEYPVTTFKNAEKILNTFKESEIHAVDVLYTGMMNGGVDFKAFSKVQVQKELGGINGFKVLNARLADIKYVLYPDVDFTRIYEKGNGVSKKEDVSKTLSRNSAYMAEINPAYGSRYSENKSYLVNPILYKDMVYSFLKNYRKLDSNKIYLSSIGAYLSGNYSMNAGVTRQTSYMLTTQMLDTLKENNYVLKLDYGNDYVLPYASSLSNIPTTSSQQRLESYPVPFVGMVLKGYMDFTGKAINQSNNSDTAILQAIESGAGLNYLLMEEKQLSLVDTNQMSLFSVNYQLWMEEIIETYKKINADVGYLSNVAIKEHKQLEHNVKLVTYEDGSKVYVNYNNTAFESKDGEVEAMSYLVVR